ncbi:unnamed protein product [Oikopleura dioica]|uniref:Uncharacterized protein n=1 Tax=Oikopleura dioica TaxID=34765 RepID=E4YX79_OIKDI|nr:unnamed protein product [Oikopleura dioica]
MGGSESKDSGVVVESAVEVSRTMNSPVQEVNLLNGLTINGFPGFPGVSSSALTQSNQSIGAREFYSEVADLATELWSGSHFRNAESDDDMAEAVQKDKVFMAAIIPLLLAVILATVLGCICACVCRSKGRPQRFPDSRADDIYLVEEPSKSVHDQVTPRPVQYVLLCLVVFYFTGSVATLTILFQMRNYV